MGIMFGNLFKSDTLVVDIVSGKKYNKDITLIHNEFNKASEIALEETKAMLKELDVNDNDRMSRLYKLGFTRVPKAKAQKDIKDRRSAALAKANRYTHWKLKYPNNKFISEKDTAIICKKWNLILGDIGLFTGYVPVENQGEIAKFKLKKWDIIIKRRSEYGSDFIHMNFYKLKWFLNRAQIANVMGGKEILDEGYFYQLAAKNTMQIAAPVSQMHIPANFRLDDYEIKEKPPEDPIVLQPVRRGYLIVTAWGDEADDPIIKD